MADEIGQGPCDGERRGCDFVLSASPWIQIASTVEAKAPVPCAIVQGNGGCPLEPSQCTSKSSDQLGISLNSRQHGRMLVLEWRCSFFSVLFALTVLGKLELVVHVGSCAGLPRTVQGGGVSPVRCQLDAVFKDWWETKDTYF